MDWAVDPRPGRQCREPIRFQTEQRVRFQTEQRERRKKERGRLTEEVLKSSLVPADRFGQR